MCVNRLGPLLCAAVSIYSSGEGALAFMFININDDAPNIYLKKKTGVGIAQRYLSLAESLRPTPVLSDCHQAVNVVIAAAAAFLQNIRFHLKIECHFHVRICSSRCKR